VILMMRNYVHVDSRGWFTESYSSARWRAAGVSLDFVQDNHSLSIQRGTLRGLHFQSPPFAQAKIVRCLRGRLFDVIVDLRRGSPTYGQSECFELDASDHELVLIPEGFAHGFMTLEDNSEIFYKVTQPYAPRCDHGVKWSDPDIAISWPMTVDKSLISTKDLNLPLLKDLDSPFSYDGSRFEIRRLA
jgi:dTDP-4-dehydrorhamnose 3,5-epimerase